MNYCKRCVSPSTRPRLEFDSNGVCNACNYHDKKQTEIDWSERKKKLLSICDRFRRDDYWDVIVPCSGGKDGSAVAWQLKHDYGMTPLCITFAPQLQTEIGRQNLEAFKDRGFDHVLISADRKKYQQFAKDAFIGHGMPKQPFVTGISTSVLQYAVNYNIPFIMYGEQGEVEYGGTQATESLKTISRDFLIKFYYENMDPKKYGWWWVLPEQGKLDKLHPTWWSVYYDWDPENHFKISSQNCGLRRGKNKSIGTFTSTSQLDDILQDLHAYLMFIKFGFGRCTSDASIEVRRGRMTREQAVEVVAKLDGLFPLEYLPVYLDYFDMTELEFMGVLDSFANYDILDKTDKPKRPWVLKQEVLNNLMGYCLKEG